MRRSLWALLLPLVLCGSSWETTGSVHIAGSWESGSVGTAFVALADSGLSSATKAQMPYAKAWPGAGDTSGWTRVDVTSSSELSSASIGCSVLVGDGSTDNATNLDCMLDDPDSEGVCLEFPVSGTFNVGTALNGNSFYRPDNSHNSRCMVSDTPGTLATIRTDILDNSSGNDGFMLFEGEDEVIGSDLGWTAGYSRGTTDLTFTSVTGLAAGDFLKLSADAESYQSNDDVVYRPKVSSISGSGPYTVVIDEPLPDDFSGGNAAAAEWSPSTGWYVQDIHFTHENVNHVEFNWNSLWVTKGMAEFTFKNVQITGYQFGLQIEYGARARIEQFYGTLNFDKPFNNYALITANSSDIYILDSIADSPESFACGDSTQNVLVAFSYFPDPAPNASFDEACNSPTDCDWTYIQNASTGHDAVHTATGSCTDTSPADGECDQRTGETPTADALYTHCSSNEDDLLGLGTSACRGTRSDSAAGSMLLHDRSCSNLAIVRSQFEGGAWGDFNFGPGRYNMIFGSLGLEDDGQTTFSGADNGGDIAWKDNGTSILKSNYSLNHLWIGNSVNKIGGGSTNGFDVYMDGARIEYNAMRAADGCDYSGGDSSILTTCGTVTVPAWSMGAHDGANSSTVLTNSSGRIPSRTLTGAVLWNTTDQESCTVTGQTSTSITCSGGLSGSGEWNSGDEFAIAGINVTWTGNSDNVGTGTPSIGITLPSAPGLTEDPGLSGSGTFPYVGADQGGVSTGGSQNCLPAFERYHGACTQ